MALTKKDIQLITDALQPKFDQLREEFKTELKREIEGVMAAMRGLQIYMETRFRDVEHRIERLEKQNYIVHDADKS